MPTTDRVLIIEEQTLLAHDIESVLAGRGPVEVTHARRLADAPDLAVLPAFDLALIEGRLAADEVIAYTAGLVGAGVPTVVSRPIALRWAFPHATPLEKPFDATGLLAACDAAKGRIS